MELRIINKYLVVCFSILMLVFAFFTSPKIFGDGREYLGMTISFSNHLTPELLNEDITERNEVEEKNNIYYEEKLLYAGYFSALNGKYYSYHFWMYSLFCVIPYKLLQIINLNELKVFQITNVLMYIFLLYKVYKNTYLTDKGKFWLIIFSIFSPIIYYLPWSHPEVFSYVFLFVGLLAFISGEKIGAIIYTAIASLQNPAISLVALSFLIYYLVRKRIYLIRNLLNW